jgi:hypothetical protein
MRRRGRSGLHGEFIGPRLRLSVAFQGEGYFVFSRNSIGREPQTNGQVADVGVGAGTIAQVPVAVQLLFFAIFAGRTAPLAGEMHTDGFGIPLVRAQIFHYAIAAVVVSPLVADVEIRTSGPGQYDGLHLKIHVVAREGFVGTEGVKLHARRTRRCGWCGAHHDRRILPVLRLRPGSSGHLTFGIDRRNVDVIGAIAALGVERDQVIDGHAMGGDERRIGNRESPAVGFEIGAVGDEHLRSAGMGGGPYHVHSRLGGVLEVNVADLVGTPSARRQVGTAQQDQQSASYVDRGQFMNSHAKGCPHCSTGHLEPTWLRRLLNSTGARATDGSAGVQVRGAGLSPLGKRALADAGTGGLRLVAERVV